MPPKTGPAAKKDSEPVEGTEAPAVSPSVSEAKEEATETASEEAATTDEAPAEDVKVDTPDKTQREIAAELYEDEDVDLWYGEVHGLVFAFPRIATITPSRQWLRQIYALTEMAQTFEWMALAKVPQAMQNRTDLLTDDQYRAVFNAWFVDGELTLPK